MYVYTDSDLNSLHKLWSLILSEPLKEGPNLTKLRKTKQKILNSVEFHGGWLPSLLHSTPTLFKL